MYAVNIILLKNMASWWGVSKYYQTLPSIIFLHMDISVPYLNPASLISANKHWASSSVWQPKAKTPNVTILGYRLDL
jgi:hypothetical protein